jgi:hypothetical protein
MGRFGKVPALTAWVTVLLTGSMVSLAAAPAALASDGIVPLQSGLDFGSVVAGTGPYTQGLTVLNSGTTTLRLTTQSSTGFAAGLDSGTCGAALAPGSQCAAQFTVTPGQLGPLSGTAGLAFCSGACSTSVAANVPATGLVLPADTLTRSPATLAFATTAVQELSQAQTETVTNGLVEMTLGTIQVSGSAADDFVVLRDTCSGAELGPGATCTFDVRFAPTATGARAATLTVQGTTLGNAYPTIALSGTGGSLPTGDAGATGPMGATGPTGPRGPAGRVEVITCRTVSVTTGTGKHRHKVKRQRCQGKLSSGTIKFTTAAVVPATLLRGGRILATGTASRARVALEAQRQIAAGHATLRLRMARRLRSVAVTVA